MAPNWSGLAPNHIANVHRKFAYPYGVFLWMDPGAQVIADWIVAVVKDIVTRYVLPVMQGQNTQGQGQDQGHHGWE